MRTDYVPLLPTRAVTVTRTGPSVTVVLTGIGPTDPSTHEVDIRLEVRGSSVVAPDTDLAAELSSIDDADTTLGWRIISTTRTTLGVAVRV